MPCSLTFNFINRFYNFSLIIFIFIFVSQASYSIKFFSRNHHHPKMLIKTIPLPVSNHPIILPATPLTQTAFSPFGDVISNPSPQNTPFTTTNNNNNDISSLPFGASLANQGTAIRYGAIAPSTSNLYPSGAATPRISVFICGVREEGEKIEIKILERHPFTSQTFIPLAGGKYLVVVAPTSDEKDEDGDFPGPEKGKGMGMGKGMPDLKNLKAFIANGNQAVTYKAGTWHAPMIALAGGNDEGGEKKKKKTVDFVVVQAASDVPVEDCQEVEIIGEGEGEGGIWVRLSEEGERRAKL
ncbi:ureidoglycolate hydrolase [Poronia punctata]|nr:ureidoglycolate hydrolase [Poronia punctata]